MTADQIIILEAIKISTSTVVDGNYHFACLKKVRAAASASGVTHEGFNTAFAELWDAGKVSPQSGNPGAFEDKADLFFDGEDYYAGVSTTL